MRRRAWALCVIACATVVALAVACGGSDDPVSSSSSTTISTTTTTTEPPATWSEVQPVSDAPVARCYQGMVYDSDEQQVLVFSGFDGLDPLSDNWSYDPDSERWMELSAEGEGQPSADKQIAAAYAPSKKLVVSFDGTSWGYDVAANSWGALSPKGTKLKPARAGSCMVLDEESGKVVLFGGTDNIRAYNETWVYDPAENWWGKVEPEGDVPQGRSDAGMVYDPGSGLMILFGGVDADFTCLNDTWTFDPETSVWTRLAPMTRVPAARSGHAMAYDGHSGKVILFGGIDSQFVCYDDTWAYSVADNTWTELMPEGPRPDARCRSRMVYASSVDRLILFGGMTFGVDSSGGFGTPAYFGDLWTFGVSEQGDQLIP